MHFSGGKALLPRALCQRSVLWVDDAYAVKYLGEQDHAWLAALLAEYARFHGLRQRDLKQRLTEPLPVRAPRVKQRIAQHLLDKLNRVPLAVALPPREARQLLFSLAARQVSRRTTLGRAAVLEEAATLLQVSPVALDAALFADLESERRVLELPPTLTPANLAEQANLALALSLIARAREVSITLPGKTRLQAAPHAQLQAHTLVRFARRSGLLCRIEPLGALGLRLQLSGPFALFRQTRVYARALTALAERVLGTEGFELSAECQLTARGDAITVGVHAGDPIARMREPIPTETAAERHFARDLQRLAPQWELARDPEPLTLGHQLVFADFAVWRRDAQPRRWLIELVGFWTHEYLMHKLTRLKAAGFDRLILCVDTKRRCSEETLPATPLVVPYRRRVDVRAVLARIEAASNES